MPRVLRVYHSGVVSAWRQRERELVELGASVTLICARRWNEGGTNIALDCGDDDFVVGARTVGRHPNLFAYDPVCLWRVLRRADFDVLDIHEEPVSIAAAEVQILSWLARRRAPFCLYSAQNIEKRYPIPFRWLECVALRRTAAVHTCNDEAGHIARRKGLRGPVRNLGLGIDVGRFAPSAAPHPGTPMRVGYVGRLEAHKGVNVLIDAVAQCGSSTLTIAGDGPERTALEKQVVEHGSSGSVTIVGHVSQDALPDFYRSLDVLAVPSLETPGWVEQFGRVAVEAMASGLPVVASASGSLPEVVGDAGLLVSPGDASALAGALEQLEDDPPERMRLGKLARTRAQRYSWDNVARQQLDLYREMLVSAR